MNKMLTVSLVAVLGVAGGGAYMYMNPEKNFSQYIPEPVTNLLGEYVPGFSDLNTSTESTVVIEEYVQDTEEPFMEQQVEVDAVQAQAEPQEMQEVSEEQLLSQSDDNESGDEIVAEVMDEIQKSINEVTADEVVDNKKTSSADPKAVSLEKEIDQVSSEIVKIDFENSQLEQKFQEILRKNRELAKQLKDIDEKLAATN